MGEAAVVAIVGAARCCWLLLPGTPFAVDDEVFEVVPEAEFPERGDAADRFEKPFGAAKRTAFAALLEVRAPYVAALTEEVPAAEELGIFV